MGMLPALAGGATIDPIEPGAIYDPPRIQTSWTIANESWFGQDWFQPADGDDITVNSGGIVHCNWNWSGADGSRDLNGIDVNAGGVFIQHNGTRIDINTGQDIAVNEGGQWRSLGTEASRCELKGEDNTSATHYLRSYKAYFEYTDIDSFYYVSPLLGGDLQFINSTLTDMGINIYAQYTPAHIYLINSTVSADTAGRNCIFISYGGRLTAINCAFTSVTDNNLVVESYEGIYDFAGCTYQGAAILPNDFSYTAGTFDIRVYGACDIKTNQAAAKIAVDHPAMNTLGFIEDDTNYLQIPGYLSYGNANTTVYLLNWTGYWRSGLAIADRVQMNWSNGGAAASGYNQQWNITVGYPGYQSNYTTIWSGSDATIDLTAVPTVTTVETVYLNYSEPVEVYNNSAGTNNTGQIDGYAAAYFNGSYAVVTADDLATVNVTVHNSDHTAIAWLLNATHSMKENVSVNLTELNSDTIISWTNNGTAANYYINVTIELANNSYDIWHDREWFYVGNMTEAAAAASAAVGGPVSGTAGGPVVFGYDFDYEIHGLQVNFIYEGQAFDSIRWSFGDGFGSNETNPSWTYAEGGNYTVYMEVVTLAGQTYGVEKVVRLDKAPLPFLAQIPGFIAWLPISASLLIVSGGFSLVLLYIEKHPLTDIFGLVKREKAYRLYGIILTLGIVLFVLGA